MKLSPAQVHRVQQQIDGRVIPNRHTLSPQLQRAFGNHTFFLDSEGLNIVEPSPADSQVGNVVKLASWADDDHTTGAAPRKWAMSVGAWKSAGYVPVEAAFALEFNFRRSGRPIPAALPRASAGIHPPTHTRSELAPPRKRGFLCVRRASSPRAILDHSLSHALRTTSGAAGADGRRAA
jgi:hypothetical protein